MDIGHLLDRQAIIAKVSAASKRHALSTAGEIAARLYGLKGSAIADSLIERERKGSTGVGSGVAVPHARVDGLTRMRGIFMRLETPIDFGAVDDQPVDLMFVLLAPADAKAEHLQALARISRALRKPELREQLRQARTQDALHALLVADAQSSAA
jgi:PTS system nitrogen regulatory IIA component